MLKKTLADLNVGEEGVISVLSDYDLSLKLLDMGCLPGSPVKVSNKAPFGGPICFTICGYKLSLRRDEAQSILIN